jgi:2-dehydro-3-deoxygluconokinase
VTDIVTVGEATLRLSPPQGERIETAREFAAHVGGPESNVAVAAATLGLDATWLSKLPDSPLGRRVVGDLRRHGVRTGVVWTDAGGSSVAFVERGGATGRTVVPDRSEPAAATTTADELPLGVVREAGTLFITGATAARSESLRETTATLLEAAGEAGTIRAFDTRFDATGLDPETALELYDRLLGRVDVLVVDETDAEAVFGLDGEMVAVGHSLRTRYDCSTVVITRREPEHPTVGLHGEEIYEVPPFDVETRDRSGAHDALVGGFLAGRQRGADVKWALTDGAAAAALTRTVIGDVVVGTGRDVAAIRDGRGGK